MREAFTVPPMEILVVDDNRINRKVTESLLKTLKIHPGPQSLAKSLLLPPCRSVLYRHQRNSLATIFLLYHISPANQLVFEENHQSPVQLTACKYLLLQEALVEETPAMLALYRNYINILRPYGERERGQEEISAEQQYLLFLYLFHMNSPFLVRL